MRRGPDGRRRCCRAYLDSNDTRARHPIAENANPPTQGYGLEPTSRSEVDWFVGRQLTT
jgi:hypothetical protein